MKEWAGHLCLWECSVVVVFVVLFCFFPERAGFFSSGHSITGVDGDIWSQHWAYQEWARPM